MRSGHSPDEVMELSLVPGSTPSVRKPFPRPKSHSNESTRQRSRSVTQRSRIFGLVSATMLIACGAASASNLTGSVTNRTTNKPAAGSEVVLLTLSQIGMKEVARSTTDSAGRFGFTVPEKQADHLLRVIYRGITYHKMPEPEASSVAIEVYDTAEKLEGLTAVMDVQRFEARGDTLEVKELITMRNASVPPRTLMNGRPFEIQLPPEAQVESGLVQVENGQPLKYKPTPSEQKGRYYFLFPLRPGNTRFAVVYRLPYRGAAIIEPRILNPQERFVVMLPKSMKFEPGAQGVFQPMPGVTQDNVLGTAPVEPGQTVSFRISGTGTLVELEGRRQEAQAAETTRPGGGLGPPIELPDPLHDQRWFILGGLAVGMAVGAVCVLRRRAVLSPAVAREALHTPHQRGRIDRRRSQVPLNGPRKRRVGL